MTIWVPNYVRADIYKLYPLSCTLKRNPCWNCAGFIWAWCPIDQEWASCWLSTTWRPSSPRLHTSPTLHTGPHTALEPLSLSYLQPPTWRVLCAGTWFVSADNINNATAWLSEWFSFLVEFTDNPSSEMISSPLLPLLTFLVLVEPMAAIPTIVQTLSSRLYNEHAPHIFTLSSPS